MVSVQLSAISFQPESRFHGILCLGLSSGSLYGDRCLHHKKRMAERLPKINQDSQSNARTDVSAYRLALIRS